MPETAVLVTENLSQFCPVTNHYRCSDGRYLLVTYPRLDVLGTLAALDGMSDVLEVVGLANAPVSVVQQPNETVVYLADEGANILPVDGEIRPLHVCGGPDSVEDAVKALGYVLA